VNRRQVNAMEEAKLFQRNLTRGVGGSDAANGVFCKQSLVVEGAAPPWSAALLRHIGHVVRVRSEPKVFGVAAQGIIAAVQDVHPLRDWPDMDLVGRAIAENPLAPKQNDIGATVALAWSVPIQTAGYRVQRAFERQALSIRLLALKLGGQRSSRPPTLVVLSTIAVTVNLALAAIDRTWHSLRLLLEREVYLETVSLRRII
jgi:hypothetical protein